jgi:aryl-alcohol dehydrogenase-like predicted oxidoreductase
MKVLNALDKVADEHDASAATIALVWLLNKPGVVAPVVSASTATQVPELLAAARVHLTRHQSAELDRASAY